MSVINEEYIDNIVEQINNIPDCLTLQALTTKIEKDLLKQIEKALNSIEMLEPLVEAPSDIGEVIEWIKNVILIIYKPYTQAIELQAELLEAYSRIMIALSLKVNNMDCSILIPQVPDLPTIPTPPDLPF